MQAVCTRPGKICRQAPSSARARSCSAAAAASTEQVGVAAPTDSDALMIRALRGDDVDRSPVWMMRQAGRYMKVYQDLCKVHKTFRQRSENVDVSVEVTLQPWHAFKPDGVVLFSDILTPLTGMNIPFDIIAGTGPVISNPIRSLDAVESIQTLDAEKYTPYVGGALEKVRAEVGNEAAVLGFAGAPFTLASYIVEGGSSKNYSNLKELAFSEPKVLHALLDKLTDNVTDYLRYQADHGAQVVQVFDSWASHLSPRDFDTFAAPYTSRILADFRKTHPHVPTILYISGSGGLLERMAACKPDCLSIDGSVDLGDAIRRCGTDFAYQGNIDPGCLYGSHEFIEQRIRDTVKTASDAGVRHVLNLGHGVLPTTPEANVEHYFKTARSLKYSDL